MISENDVWVRGPSTDRYYTQGLELEYSMPEGDLYDPLKSVSGSQMVNVLLLAEPPPGAGSKKATSRANFYLGQQFFTPEDITATVLQEDDRPYAGWLYVGAGLERSVYDESDPEDHSRTIVRAFLGVVGPSALGGEIQRWWHDFTGDPDKPSGWQHQLNDELGVLLDWRRDDRIYRPERDGLQFDFATQLGGSLGNVRTSVDGGGTVRLGLNLPRDWGPRVASVELADDGKDGSKPEENFHAYVHGSLVGSAVLRNIFLDGNTFEDSHSVSKRPLVGDARLGLVVAYKALQLGYTYVYRTEEFEGQRGGQEFGSYFLSWTCSM